MEVHLVRLSDIHKLHKDILSTVQTEMFARRKSSPISQYYALIGEFNFLSCVNDYTEDVVTYNLLLWQNFIAPKLVL